MFYLIEFGLTFSILSCVIVAGNSVVTCCPVSRAGGDYKLDCSCLSARWSYQHFVAAALEYSVKYSGGGWLTIKGVLGIKLFCVNVFVVCCLFGIYELFYLSVLCMYLLCVAYNSLLVCLLIELFCELFSWCDYFLCVLISIDKVWSQEP